MVQRTGFEPVKHYALGPHPSPFDHSGTPAWELGDQPRLFQNGEAGWAPNLVDYREMIGLLLHSYSAVSEFLQFYHLGNLIPIHSPRGV